MCGSLFGGAKAPKQTPVAPPTQQVVRDELRSVDKVAADKERRRSGYNSTLLSNDRVNPTILGALNQVTGAMKKKTGE
jgi:hypothetical protein